MLERLVSFGLRKILGGKLDFRLRVVGVIVVFFGGGGRRGKGKSEKEKPGALLIASGSTSRLVQPPSAPQSLQSRSCLPLSILLIHCE